MPLRVLEDEDRNVPIRFGNWEFIGDLDELFEWKGSKKKKKGIKEKKPD